MSSSNIPLNIIQKINTEEILNDIEIENNNNEITSHCSICNVEMQIEVDFVGAIICDQCETGKNVWKQCELEHLGQEKAAEKMLKVLSYIYHYIFFNIINQ